MALHLALEAIGLRDVAQCGGKAARLGEAARLGVPVPRSVVLPTELYRRYMRQGGLQGEIAAILGTLQPSAWTHFRAAEWAIQSAFRARRTPAQIESAIAEAYQTLGLSGVAVRSSATSEDSPQLSFVGQHHSDVLNSADEAAVVQSVLRCWMSLFSAKALSYAHHFGVDLLNTSMAVLLQQAIAPERRGTLFTADPISGSPDVFLLELTADSQPAADLSGVRQIDPYNPTPDLPFPLARLREIGLLLDEHCVQYQCIEWATAGGQLWVLRLRPITAVPAYIPCPAGTAGADAYQLVKPGDQSARAALPHSHYHISRARGQRLAAAGPNARRTRAESQPQDLYICGYHYARVASQDATVTQTGAAGTVARCRAWTRAARSLRRDLSAQRLQLRASLDELASRRPAEMPPAELHTHIVRVTGLCDALVQQSNTLGASHATLGSMVEQMRRSWSTASPSGPALVPSVAGAQTRRDAELCQLARVRYASEEQRDSAFAAFWQQHQHLYFNGDPLSDGQDISTLAPDAAAARAQFELCSAPENTPSERHEAETTRQRAEAERLTLAGMRPVQRLLFRRCLRVARSYAPLALERDEPALLGLMLEREAIFEVGRRLQAAGVCEQADDVFSLTYTELLAWLLGQSASEELAPRVRARLLDRQRWTRYSPPPMLPVESAGAQLAASEGGAIMALSGRPICRGLVQGTAQVIRSLPEAGGVLPGQVLVCREPQFELSPLFGVVSAVVSEAGGVLDPAAVLVREFGVPAVFGVAGATEQLHTGDALLVDAHRGRVLRLRPALA